MTPEKFEDEIVALLKHKIPETFADVYPCPEDPEEYESWKPQAKPALFVTYDDTKYEATETMKLIGQPTKVGFCILIQSRLRRGKKGVLAFEGILRKILVGYTPTDCTKKIWAVYFGSPKGDIPPQWQDLWNMEMHFETESVYVEEQGSVFTDEFTEEFA